MKGLLKKYITGVVELKIKTPLIERNTAWGWKLIILYINYFSTYCNRYNSSFGTVYMPLWCHIACNLVETHFSLQQIETLTSQTITCKQNMNKIIKQLTSLMLALWIVWYFRKGHKWESQDGQTKRWSYPCILEKKAKRKECYKGAFICNVERNEPSMINAWPSIPPFLIIHNPFCFDITKSAGFKFLSWGFDFVTFTFIFFTSGDEVEQPIAQCTTRMDRKKLVDWVTRRRAK